MLAIPLQNQETIVVMCGLDLAMPVKAYADAGEKRYLKGTVERLVKDGGYGFDEHSIAVQGNVARTVWNVDRPSMERIG